MEDTLFNQILSELENIINNNDLKSKRQLDFKIQCLELMKDILFSLNDVILLLNDSSEIIWVNSSSTNILGYTPEEIKVIGYSNFINRIHPEDYLVTEKIRKLISSGKEYSAVLRLKLKNGHYIWLKNVGKVFKRNIKGIPQFFIIISTDISNIIKIYKKGISLKDKSKKAHTNLVNSNITKREIEILQLIAEGFPGKLIADKLNISFNTVRTHRNNLMKKLNINCTAALVNYYLDQINTN